MKKFALCLILTSLLVVPVMTLAADQMPRTGSSGAGITTVTTLTIIQVMGALDNITDWLFAILLVVAAIAIIIAAFQFITAAGDIEKVGSARQFVLYALVGVAVALLAKGLVALVQTIIK